MVWGILLYQLSVKLWQNLYLFQLLIDDFWRRSTPSELVTNAFQMGLCCTQIGQGWPAVHRPQAFPRAFLRELNAARMLQCTKSFRDMSAHFEGPSALL